MAFRRILIVVALAAAVACGSSSSSSPSPSTASSAAVTVSIPSGARNLTTNAFGANPLVVAVGTTVTWTNNDSITHNSVADGGMWNSGSLTAGQSFQFRFTTAGSFPY